MRNIKQYPVTKGEVQRSLQHASDKYINFIGSMEPYIFERLSTIIEHMSDNEFEKWFHVK